jgi:nucleolar MIF4G domain-containing protein 1
VHSWLAVTEAKKKKSREKAWMEYGSRKREHFGRGGRFFKPSSPEGFSRAHDSSYTARYDNASGVSLDADVEVDRQRDRKERRKRERQEKKQARIAMHERLAEERRQARQQRQESRAATQAEAQRKRQRVQLAASKSERLANKQKKQKREEALVFRASDSKIVSGAFPVSSAGKKTVTRRALAKSSGTASSEPASVAALPLPPSSSSSSSAVPAASDATVVPPQVTEKVRRLVNKLTMTNVVDLTNDLSEFMSSAGVSRAAVVKGLAQQLERLCRLETGPMHTTGTLPFAGLLRGVQLLHGNQVGAELVERVSLSLQGQLAAGEEAAAGNTLMVLAQLYLLYGVDVVFVMSLLRMLLQQGTRILDKEKPGTSTTSSIATQAVCAAACGLVLMRACGEKLLKESPSELEAALQEARKVSAQMRSVTGTARFSALVEVMGDIAAGRTRKSRRTATEEAAPVDSMLTDLCSLLPGQEKATAAQRHTMKRLVLSKNVLSGLTWSQVTAPEKPPRWYVPGVMPTEAARGASDNFGRKQRPRPGSDTDAGERLSSDGEDDDSSAVTHSPATSESDEDDAEEKEEELDEYELKRERIARMRTEEKAISGQRLNTEHKREIFKCIASATDDLECFTMLMYRDPGYTRFHDVCSVLLQCVCQEKKYNLYYVQVLLRFCSAKPACVKTLQFAIWDRFKAIRIEPADIVGYFNLSCCLADLVQSGVYNLGILRGLDLENTNKTIGLFTRMLLLRLIFQLPPARLTQFFFGGDGRSAHDLQVDTSTLRRLLVKFMELYFVDDNASKRWLPNFYDVVAAGTEFDTTQPFHGAGAMAQQSSAVVAAETEARLLARNANRPTSTLSAHAATPSSLRPAAASASTEAVSASSPEALLMQFMKRLQVVYKALKQGIS